MTLWERTELRALWRGLTRLGRGLARIAAASGGLLMVVGLGWIFVTHMPEAVMPTLAILLVLFALWIGGEE